MKVCPAHELAFTRLSVDVVQLRESRIGFGFSASSGVIICDYPDVDGRRFVEQHAASLVVEQALSRQRMTEPVFVLALAEAVVGRLSGNPASVSIALAGAALILALVGIQYWQQQPSVEEIEEIDAAILTGDLPVSAYLDKSFDTWLKRSQH